MTDLVKPDSKDYRGDDARFERRVDPAVMDAPGHESEENHGVLGFRGADF
jgi:hypothetical protein